MANIIPTASYGGYPVGWVIPLTLTGSVIDSAGTVYEMNNVQDASLTYAVDPSSSSTTDKTTETALDGTSFTFTQVTTTIDFITGVEESSSSGGTGGVSKISLNSLTTHYDDDIEEVTGMFDGGVLIILPYFKTYKAGSAVTVSYVALLGKISADVTLSGAGNTVVKLPVEVSGGNSYTDSGTVISTAVGALSAIIPAGQDSGGAGIAAPTTISDLPKLLTGKITKLT